ISRKEVRRQRELLDDPAPQPANKTTDATRVLSGWHQDPTFTYGNGRPRLLPIDGDGATFTSLCRSYAGDIPVTTMLKELKRVGAVVETQNGQLKVQRRYYMPAQFDPQWVMNAGNMFADLGANINANLAAGKNMPTRFLGRASEPFIDADAIPEFRQFIETQGQQFLEVVDDWLSRRRGQTDGHGTGRQVRLGVGLFLIQDEDK
ncbi:MAG: DUF6502 family protein, partial [Pseudomonadales bacterium]|nr:DUF6502 family protein [Pseudomonadales bacterium]